MKCTFFWQKRKHHYSVKLNCDIVCALFKNSSNIIKLHSFLNKVHIFWQKRKHHKTQSLCLNKIRIKQLFTCGFNCFSWILQGFSEPTKFCFCNECHSQPLQYRIHLQVSAERSSLTNLSARQSFNVSASVSSGLHRDLLSPKYDNFECSKLFQMERTKEKLILFIYRVRQKIFFLGKCFKKSY